MRPTTRLLYLESPTNPTLKIIDIEKIAAFAKQKEITTIIDSTFNAPINLKPLGMGIDLVVHSATKYLSGHSDLMAGAIAALRSRLSGAGFKPPQAAVVKSRGRER